MDQFCEDTSENGVTALSKIPETPIPASTSATGNLRDRTNPRQPAMVRTSPTNANAEDTMMSDPIELTANDIEMAEITQKEPNTQRYTYRVLQIIQMKLIILCVWAEPAILGSTKTALKFKYEI